MKKLTILMGIALAILLTACSPKIYYQSNVGYINYESFSEDGMFLSESNSVSFDYTPLGSVSVTVLSGNVEKTRPDRYNYVDIYGKQPDEKYKTWVVASPEDAIKQAVLKAKEQGGNGIINIRIEPINDINAKFTRSGFLMTGMVIKR